MPSQSGRWLVQSPRDCAPLLRLFCFPYAGGGPSMFRQWRSQLPEWVDLVPVLLPGRESRISEAPFTNLEPLTETVVEAMASELDVPYALFGHSMGALVAFEAARRLDAGPGRRPSLLLVSGRAAPHSRPRERMIHQLPDDHFINYLQQVNGTQPEIFEDRSLLDILLPVLRADFTVCETYVYRPGQQLTCPITSFGGLEDLEVAEADVAAWSIHSAARFQLNMLSGGHFFINSERARLVSLVARECASVGAAQFAPIRSSEDHTPQKTSHAGGT